MFWNRDDDEFIIIRNPKHNRSRNYDNPVQFVLFVVWKIIKWVAIIILGLFIFRKASQAFTSLFYQITSILSY